MVSNKKLSEKDIQNIAMQHQQMQYQAEAISNQINLVAASIGENQLAINSITEFENVEEGHEVLVPIGSGTNVRANLVKPDSVIIEVGVGISVEKNLDEAKKSLENRKDELTEYQQNLQKNLNELVNKMKEMEAVVAAAVGKQQTQPKPMQGS